MNSNRRNFLLSCLTVAFAFAAMLGSTATTAHAKNGNRNETKIEGTLIAKNLTTGVLSIRKQGGAVVTVKVPATAKVERNDLHSSLRAFKIGDFVQVRSVNGTVVKVEAVGP